MVQQHEIEQEMDDDVQTDDGIIYHARGTCWTDITEMYQSTIRKQIAAIAYNKEISVRIRFINHYSRSGRFREDTDYIPSPDKMCPRDTLRNDILQHYPKRVNSISRFENQKMRQKREEFNDYGDEAHQLFLWDHSK